MSCPQWTGGQHTTLADYRDKEKTPGVATRGSLLFGKADYIG
jgi:hypothetical protein